jgi:membrane protein implicated in regulation of membrane protease activity
MELVTNNLAQALLILGLVILVIEVLVLGFSTFFLFFLALGLIATSLLFFASLIPETVIAALISTSLISALSAVLLWKPLKNMQNNVDKEPVENDFIGQTFQLKEALPANGTVKHQYSGISWNVSSEQDIAAGEEVEVTWVGVGRIKVKKAGNT